MCKWALRCCHTAASHHSVKAVRGEGGALSGWPEHVSPALIGSEDRGPVILLSNHAQAGSSSGFAVSSATLTLWGFSWTVTLKQKKGEGTLDLCLCGRLHFCSHFNLWWCRCVYVPVGVCVASNFQMKLNNDFTFFFSFQKSWPWTRDCGAKISRQIVAQLSFVW